MSSPPPRSLADIELQLIMRALDLPSLLRFSRCSHSNLRAANSPFALEFVTVRVTIPGSAYRQLRSSRILRHVPLALRVESWATPSSDELCATIQEIGSPLHEFDASQCKRFAAARWKEMLRHPAFQSLRCLRIHAGSTKQDLDAELVAIILTLPHLHTLAIQPMHADPASWTVLADARQLTALSIQDSAKDDRRSLLPLISQCRELRTLRVLDPALDGGGAFSACFCSPSLRGLEELELAELHCSGSMLRRAVSAEDYSSGFLNLRSLQRLTLCHICCIDDILPHVQRAPALRALTIIPQAYREPEGSSTPTPFTLVKLLRACPQLHCTLTFQLPRQPQMPVYAPFIRTARDVLDRFASDDLLEQLGGRFEVRYPPECLGELEPEPIDVPPPRFGGRFQCVVQ